MSGRVIVLTGLPGSGKTSTAKYLKKEHDFIYFEGDVWSWGDGVLNAEDTPTPEMIAKARENADKMKAIMTMGAEFYAKVQTGAEPNYEAAYTFYDMMMGDVLKVKEENPDKNIVVVHAINHKKVRDHLRKVLGADSSVLCLDVPHAALKQRNLERLEGKAKDAGKTLEEFVMAFPGANLPAEYEARLEQFTNPGIQQLEQLSEDEVDSKAVQVITVDPQEGQDVVAQKVVRVLGIAK